MTQERDELASAKALHRLNAPDDPVISFEQVVKELGLEDTVFKTRLYIYGTLLKVDTPTATIFIQSQRHGVVAIESPLAILEHLAVLKPQHPIGVHVEAQQTLDGALQTNSIRFLGLLDYSPADTQFVDEIASGKYAEPWKDVQDSVAWVRELRGEI